MTEVIMNYNQKKRFDSISYQRFYLLNIEKQPDLFILSIAGASLNIYCLLYTSPSPRDGLLSRMPSSA